MKKYKTLKNMNSRHGDAFKEKVPGQNLTNFSSLVQELEDKNSDGMEKGWVSRNLWFWIDHYSKVERL